MHFARPWTQAYKPTLTDSRLASKRRAEALHEVFFSAAAAAAVYSRMIRSHERRALGALLFLLSGSEPAPTDS